MKEKCAAAVAAAMATLAAVAGNVYWNSSVSYGWNDPRQWKEERVPGAGDTVYLYNSAHAVVTDDEWGHVSAVDGIKINSSSSLTIDVSNSCVYTGLLVGTDGARIVKLGGGQARFEPVNPNYVHFSGWLIASNGTLHVERVYHSADGWPKVDVGPDGVFSYGSAYNTYSLFQGLSGAGVVRYAAGEQLIFRGTPVGYADSAPEYAFSGRFEGATAITVGNQSVGDGTAWACRQSILSASNGVSSTVRLYGGTLSVASVGNGTLASPGSLGVAGKTWFYGTEYGAEMRLRYLGTGETVSSRAFQFSNSYGKQVVVLDGGPNGGLMLANPLTYSPSATYDDGRLMLLVLDGEGGTPCGLASSLTDNSQSGGIALEKRGSGTWKLSGDGLGWRGPVDVKAGVLDFDSIAPAGSPCSLGYSTALHTNYYGQSGGCAVPYALAVGDGRTDVCAADLATLRYSGETGTVMAATAGRPVAIRGAGALSDAGVASIEVSDIFSAQGGENALVLDGSMRNAVRSATNGVGTLSRIVKRGSGTWKIGGDLSATKMSVDGGTLEIGSATNDFRYFRLSIRELQGASEVNMMFRAIAFWDEDRTLVTANLAWREAAEGYVHELEEGELAMADADWSVFTGDTKLSTMNRICVDDHNGGYWTRGAAIDKNDRSTWMTFVFRLPGWAKRPARYDLRAWGGTTTRDPKSWIVEGSADGVSWTLLSTVDSAVQPTTSQGWFSNPGYADKFANSTSALLPGYALDYSGHVAPVRASGMEEISVAEGAVLSFGSPVSVAGITYDAAAGCGTIKGADFAAGGEISLVGVNPDEPSFLLPYGLEGCLNLGAVSSWAVSLNGTPRPDRYSVRATRRGISVVKVPGLIMVVR